jgi:hypothetical protein
MLSGHREENQKSPIEFVSFSIKSLQDRHVVMIIASFVIYFAGFGVLYAITKTTVGVFLALLPVMAIAWSFGMIGGLLGAILIFVIQNILEFIFREEIVYFLPPLWMIFSYIMIFVVGAIIGYISSLNRKLNRALGEIKLLRGLIPVCASCKRIRDDKGAWYQFEDYFRLTSAVRFDLMLCPQCEELLFHKGEKEYLEIKMPESTVKELPSNVIDELKQLNSFQRNDLTNRLSEGVLSELKQEISFIGRLLPIDQYKIQRIIQNKLYELLIHDIQLKKSSGN